MSKGAYALAAIILILLVLLVAIFISKTPVQNVLSSAFIVQLTDPPQVPNGTQSLVITYSNIQLHDSNTNGFISLNESGSINLMSLINLTQTIGATNLPSNTIIDQVRFNVTSAKITIDNQTYNVSVPNNRVNVLVHANTSNSGGVLVDLVPSVIQIYSGNETIFVMVPTAKAVVISRSSINASSVSVGHREMKTHEVRAELEEESPNISIVAASASVNGNATTISVTVKDNSNQSAVLKHLFVFGIMEATINYPNGIGMMPVQNGSNGFGAYGNANVSAGFGYNGFVVGNSATGGSFGIGSRMVGNLSANATYATALRGFMRNISAYINSTGMYQHDASAIIEEMNRSMSQLNSSEIDEMENMVRNSSNFSIMVKEHEYNPEKLHDMLEEINVFNHHFHHMLNFIINANGTLSLPFVEQEAEGPNGYVLQPGQSVTLTYSGIIHFGPGLSAGQNEPRAMPNIIITLLQNQTYTIRVTGEEDAFASTNVVAS